MSAEKIESLLSGAGLTFKKIDGRKWELSGGGINPDACLEWLDHPSKADKGFLKIYSPIAKLPPAADAAFLKDIFRKNRDMGHGAFALMDDDVVVFIDTLELENCDQNEMDATIIWLQKAGGIFKEKLDRAKLPYLDTF